MKYNEDYVLCCIEPKTLPTNLVPGREGGVHTIYLFLTRYPAILIQSSYDMTITLEDTLWQT